MKSNNHFTLPPDDQRCFHLDSRDGTRCPNWAMANLPCCPKHEPASPKPSGELRPGRLEGMVDNLFLIQDLLANAIKTKAQDEALDILTLVELSRNFTHNALNITRTLKEKQAIEAPQNDWSVILAEISLELEQEEP